MQYLVGSAWRIAIFALVAAPLAAVGGMLRDDAYLAGTGLLVVLVEAAALTWWFRLPVDGPPN